MHLLLHRDHHRCISYFQFIFLYIFKGSRLPSKGQFRLLLFISLDTIDFQNFPFQRMGSVPSRDVSSLFC